MLQGTRDEFFFYGFDTGANPKGPGVVIILKVSDAPGQLVRFQYVAGTGDDGPLDDVFQLPHISRPGIGLETTDEIGRNPPNGFLEVVTGAFDEMIGEKVDIALALSQGRHGDV